MNGVAKSYLRMLAENPDIWEAEIRKAIAERSRALTKVEDTE